MCVALFLNESIKFAPTDQPADETGESLGSETWPAEMIEELRGDFILIRVRTYNYLEN